MAARPWLWDFSTISRRSLSDDPIVEFARWFRRARRSLWLEFPEAMCLSTLGSSGYPDGRFVLLKDFGPEGFVFYTNTLSEKGQALKTLPKASLAFYWEPLHRQVRIQGDIVRVSDKEADRYFASRPRVSQIGAWASLQSQALDCRSTLDKRVEEFKARFRGSQVPRPQHWHGYRVVPVRMEFWKLRANRLHDRFVYTRQEDGSWKLGRLYP